MNFRDAVNAAEATRRFAELMHGLKHRRPASLETQAQELKPYKCPECEREGYQDNRGYFYCDFCGVSW